MDKEEYFRRMDVMHDMDPERYGRHMELSGAITALRSAKFHHAAEYLQSVRKSYDITEDEYR